MRTVRRSASTRHLNLSIKHAEETLITKSKARRKLLFRKEKDFPKLVGLNQSVGLKRRHIAGTEMTSKHREGQLTAGTMLAKLANAELVELILARF